MISFNNIQFGLRTPGQYIEFDNSRAVRGLPAIANRILLIGQKLATGTAAELTFQPIVEADQASTLFGRASQLHRMAKFLKAADNYSECVAIAIDDPAAGTAATGTIAVTGPATATGTIALMIAGQSVPVVVPSGTSAAATATLIGAAITAALDLPVTASVTDDDVTITARHKGLIGNDIDIRHSHYSGEVLPSGIGLTITDMASGAGEPDYAEVTALLGDNEYRTIIVGSASTAVLDDMETELNDRWGPLRMLESFCYAGMKGTQAAMATFGDGRNSELVSIIGSGKSPTPPWEVAASYGGTIGYHAQIDPARPFQTLELKGVLAPKEADRFTRAERELLLQDGISTFTVDGGGAVYIERAITTYQVNALDIEDVSYLDVNTPLTLAFLRQAVRIRIAAKYPRHKLANDGTRYAAGQAIVTPSVIRAELIALFRELEEAGLVEQLDQFKDDLIVERDENDANRLNALIPPDIVNQFRSFAAAIQFRL
ncbi:phage tail sheath subtilisin-like domain-containing protein [Sphingorhabdus sp. 109]|uniref:phage tail sheath subtilisin-like domain-containing protein n=1 Tax=Sphingorhabdus sp. 109 TaxID=2653173 RepID=UPI0012F241D6|nr:phage tail sheath subtilisin-like domain-containing protein [Sphingorhabdus sp. 109]VWX62594.1 Mu-like prophage FluMu tail sheath protein [Sphingorhabdus sp. 109]